MTDLARLVLLAGPSGSGKTHLAEESGLPLLDLDDFYKDGADPTLPRHPTLGIVDWDDPGSWDREGALAALEQVCRDGWADVPVYSIAADGRVGERRFEIGAAPAFVGTGIFAAELVGPSRDRGLLLDAIVVRRSRVKNFLRRLSRDLREHRKPPLTLIRRGVTLMRAEPGVVARQMSLGCRPCDREDTLAALLAASVAPR
ncbi:MAG TPA: ATP-binding protein [Actinomycetes bacterium]|nr:ATP-binding protein [Actinomycetes bacterium]